MPLGQRPYDPILAGVGVLILVDQEVAESLGFGAAHVGKPGEQFFSAQQQIVEIDGTGLLQRLW